MSNAVFTDEGERVSSRCNMASEYSVQDPDDTFKLLYKLASSRLARDADAVMTIVTARRRDTLVSAGRCPPV